MPCQTHMAASDAAIFTPLAGKVSHYLRHVEDGVPIRQIAREVGCHASTIQRQIRRVEQARDDRLIDAALTQLGANRPAQKENPSMNAMTDTTAYDRADQLDDKEALRILRRMAEPGALLAIANDMEKAVIVRDAPDGRTIRTAVTARETAQAMALRDWLVCATPGRVARYRITNAGRAALKRMLTDQAVAQGLAAEGSGFAEQHREWDHRDMQVEGSTRVTQVRFNAAESPISLLARRKNKAGEAFLTSGLVAAAERLREDFELSQMGPRVGQNWDKFLTGGERGTYQQAGAGGSEAARKRVAAALEELGPGLADVALRVCCYLEGVESTEKRLGWSARSGKVVLRIALQRLEQFYAKTGAGDMIG